MKTQLILGKILLNIHHHHQGETPMSNLARNFKNAGLIAGVSAITFFNNGCTKDKNPAPDNTTSTVDTIRANVTDLTMLFDAADGMLDTYIDATDKKSGKKYHFDVRAVGPDQGNGVMSFTSSDLLNSNTKSKASNSLIYIPVTNMTGGIDIIVQMSANSSNQYETMLAPNGVAILSINENTPGYLGIDSELQMEKYRSNQNMTEFNERINGCIYKNNPQDIAFSIQ